MMLILSVSVQRKMPNRLILKILFLLLAGSIFRLNLYAQSDSLKIDYGFINSIPQNAEVYVNGRHWGETPFRFTKASIDSLSSVNITIKLKDYIDYSFTLNVSEMPVNKTITLVPKNKLSLKEESSVEENTVNYFKTPRKIIPIVISSAVTAGSGILSYYFKKLADDNYDEYLATGNRDKFDKTKKYDIYSGVFLAAFQVGFAALIYFLLLD
jgi:hypothetical protein